ncbi:MAG: hypothetical protein ABJB86_00040 [Bacteroidota bacterium]
MPKQLKKIRFQVGVFLFGIILRWYVYNVKLLPLLEDDNSWVNWYKWIYYPTYRSCLGPSSPASFLYKFKSAITSKIAVLLYAIYLTHKIIIHPGQAQIVKLNLVVDS